MFPGGEFRPVLPETNCDPEKSDPVARDRFKESRPRASVKGSPGQHAWRSAPPAMGPGLAIATTRPVPSPRCGQPPTRPVQSRCVISHSRRPSRCGATTTVRSASSVRRPGLSPHHRSCILLAVVALLSLRTHATALCYVPLNEPLAECPGAGTFLDSSEFRSIAFYTSEARAD